MNKAEEIAFESLELSKDFKENEWIKKARESINPYNNNNKFFDGSSVYGDHSTFYRWIACLERITKPKLVLEFGADLGGSTAYLLSELPTESKLYSVEIREEPYMWCFVPEWETRITKIQGIDDRVFEKYPKDFPWDDINFYFIDSGHRIDHVTHLMNKIMSHAKKGTVIINHDTNYPDGTTIDYLKSLPMDFWTDNRKIFFNGIGLHII